MDLISERLRSRLARGRRVVEMGAGRSVEGEEGEGVRMGAGRSVGEGEEGEGVRMGAGRSVGEGEEGEGVRERGGMRFRARIRPEENQAAEQELRKIRCVGGVFWRHTLIEVNWESDVSVVIHIRMYRTYAVLYGQPRPDNTTPFCLHTASPCLEIWASSGRYIS